MTLSKQLLLLATIAGVTACSGPGHKEKAPEMTERFATTITDNGSKMFDYSIVAERPERGRSRPTGGGDSGRGRPPGEGKGGMGGGNRRGGDNQEAETTSKFYDSAAAKLEETGFCRKGYVELDSEFSRGKSRLRGECKETASDADRRDFPDQVVHATLKAPTRDR